MQKKIFMVKRNRLLEVVKKTFLMTSLKWLMFGLGLSFFVSSSADVLADSEWNQYPSLGIMTGFIKSPNEKGASVQQWAGGLGENFDASNWVKQFKESGSESLIFIAKWTDGFCFFDTKTTQFKSRRDYLKEVSEACDKLQFPLVVYFNAFCDDNPDFKKWALKDVKGEYIMLSKTFPHSMHTHYSPYGDIILSQTKEILSNYPRVDGLWLDVPYHRTNTQSLYVEKVFQQMYGKKMLEFGVSPEEVQDRKPVDEERIEPLPGASENELKEFEGRSVGYYLDNAKDIAIQCKPLCQFTTNASALSTANWNYWGRNVAPKLDYLNYEGHHYEKIQQGAQMARALPWPVEIGIKINKSWYTPYKGLAPAPMFSFKKSIALTAVALCQGANVWLDITPGYDGEFGADIDIAKGIGSWYQNIKPYLRESKPWGNIGLVYGTLPCKGEPMPTIDSLWANETGYNKNPWDEIDSIVVSLNNNGYFCEVIGQWPVTQNKSEIIYKGWPEDLTSWHVLLLPERSFLNKGQVDDIYKYVHQGGKLIVFGHGGMLNEYGQVMAVDRFYNLLGLERITEQQKKPEQVTWGLNIGDSEVKILPLFKEVKQDSAKTILFLKDSNLPVIFRNDFGKGKVYYISTSEASFSGQPKAWMELMRLTGPSPVLTVDSGNRYQFVINKHKRGFLLHVIDINVFNEEIEYKPQSSQICIEKELLGGITRASIINCLSEDKLNGKNEKNLDLEDSGTRIIFKIIPDPIASILLLP